MTPAYLTHNGETHRIYEWADILGIKRDAMLSRCQRFKRGEIGEDKLFQVGSGAVNHLDFLEHAGIRDTTEGWAKRLGVNLATFRNRVGKFKKCKMSEAMLFTPGKIQEKDKTHAVVISHNGISMTTADWARELGISAASMRKRVISLKSGKMDEKRCFTYGSVPADCVKITYKGKTYTRAGLARKLGVQKTTIDSRISLIRKGLLDKERLFTKGNIGGRDRKHVKNQRYLLSSGERISIQRLAQIADVSFMTIKDRLNAGMSVDEIFAWATDPYRKVKGYVWFRGEKEKINDAVKDLGITGSTVIHRISNGWTLRDAVSEPKVSLKESQKRAHSARTANCRRKELRKLGVII